MLMELEFIGGVEHRRYEMDGKLAIGCYDEEWCVWIYAGDGK